MSARLPPAGCIAYCMLLQMLFLRRRWRLQQCSTCRTTSRNTLIASERHVLIIKWVGQARKELLDKKEVTVRAFRKCGISEAADGSEDT